MRIGGIFAPSSGQWTPYIFPASVILAFILLMVGVGLILLGRRLKNRIKIPHYSKSLRTVVIVIWVLSLLILLWTYIMRKDVFPGAIQTGPVFPITIASAVGTFIYLAYLFRHDGIRAAFATGLLGAVVGPMVFELPFVCIVLPQTEAPTIDIITFFVPLFFAVLMTLSVLLLSSHIYLTRFSLYSVGALFIVFAGWALVGFSYPSSPIPFLLNAVSKILSFLTVAALFSKEPAQY
jgi:uncharacterized protein YhhL (DUF1145 family)